MKIRTGVILYTVIWVIALLISGFSIYQNLGDAQIINYSGIVRGGTQRLIKKELQDLPSDDIIQYLDDIIYDLTTGDGKFGLNSSHSDSYQQQLSDMEKVWNNMKIQIAQVRNGGDKKALLETSEQYYQMADTLVKTAESDSTRKLTFMMKCIATYLVMSIGFFSFWYYRKRTEINSLKNYDDLTGIHNFEAFMEEAMLQLSMGHGNDYILMYLDIDHFKMLNSAYGYAFGDELLKLTAKAILNHMEEKETCARVNADNFLILKRQQEHTVESLKDDILHYIKDHASLNISDEISFCIGACHIDTKAFTKAEIQGLIDHANLAHKNAKFQGDNQIVWYDENLLIQLYHENMILKKVHSAIEHEDFLFYLQPKFNIRDEHILAAEALVRWAYSEDQFLTPDEFIPQLENSGMISELDFYMLDHACAFLEEHALACSGFTISVNFSRVTLLQRDFYEKVCAILDQHQIKPQSIEIEIVESAFHEISEAVFQTLIKLRAHGFLISMDDFGTGYSSLDLLNTLEIDVLKIDRSFLNDMSEKGKNIIELIVQIAHNYHIKVTCEGIETQEQLDYLRTIGCDMGQGYFVSKPIPHDQFYEYYLKDVDPDYLKHAVYDYSNILQTDECIKIIMAHMEGIIYLIDDDTHELLYINQAGKKAFHIKDDTEYHGRKCYDILQSQTSPCNFCRNRIKNDQIWGHYRIKADDELLVMDKKIPLENNRVVRMEIAYLKKEINPQ